MSEQTVIKGYVNMEQVNDWPQSSAGVIHLNKHSRPKFSDISATLILGNGFSEETVRKMLPYMEHRQDCKSKTRVWLSGDPRVPYAPLPCSCGLSELLERLA